MRVVVTESAETLNTFSPFDKLSDAFYRRDFTTMRVNYQITLESFQADLIAAVLAVNQHTVFTESVQAGVSIKGLDLSIIEDVGITRPLVIIMEDADCIDPSLVARLTALLHTLHRKFPGKVNLIIDTRMSLDEIITDESVYVNLAISRIPLLSSSELCRQIKSIVFDSISCSSDLQLVGFPIADFNSDDIEFITRTCLTPRELCQQLVLMIANFCQKNPLITLATAFTSSRPLDANTVDNIESRMEQILTEFYDSNFRKYIDHHKLSHLVVSTPASVECTGKRKSVGKKQNSNDRPLSFKPLAERISVAMSYRQRLGIMGRILVNVFRALSSTPSAAIAPPTTVMDLVRFGISSSLSTISSSKFFNSIPTLIKRLEIEIDGRIGRCGCNRVIEIAEKIAELNRTELVPLLVDEMRFDESTSLYLALIRGVNEQLMIAAKSGDKQLLTSIIIQFVSCVIVDVYGEIQDEKQVENCQIEFEENACVISMLSCGKFGIKNFDQKISHPECFDPMVEFLRDSKVIPSEVVDEGLVDLGKMVRSVYDIAGAKKLASKVSATMKKSRKSLVSDKEAATTSGPVGVTRANFSVDFVLSKFSESTIGSTLATMDFIGIVKQPGFVDIASGTVSGTTSAVKIRKMYNDTWFVPSVADTASDAADDDD